MRLLTDENFNGAILRGLVRRLPELDIVRVQDVGLIHQKTRGKPLDERHGEELGSGFNRL